MKFFLIIQTVLVLGISVSNAQDKWCAVMMESNHSQTYESDSIFPENLIVREWENSHYITEIAYTNKKWCVVTGKVNYEQQVYKRDRNFPGSWIEEKWKEGFNLTKVAYGENTWVVVMSKGAGLTGETWATKGNISDMENYISKKWDEGKDIVDIEYGRDTWFVALAEGSDYDSQVYKSGTEFPIEWVEDRYEEGKHITSLAYGEGIWAVVMSAYSTSKEEQYVLQTEFPKEFIKSEWDKGKRITILVSDYDNSNHNNDGVDEKVAISWESPKSVNTSSDTDTYELVACVKSSVKIKNIKLSLNGIKQDCHFDSIENCDYQIIESINLSEGTNKIEVIVETVSGARHSDQITLAYTPGSEK